MKHPAYIAICALSCIFLYYTNHGGFSLFAQPASRGSGAGAHSSGFYHK